MSVNVALPVMSRVLIHTNVKGQFVQNTKIGYLNSFYCSRTETREIDKIIA